LANPLRELKKQGQSVWYDNLNRSLIVNGGLRRMTEEDGVSGGTSNPSIFEKALGGSDVYDDHFAELARRGGSLDDIFDGLSVTDIQQSADVFGPVYDETRGKDGYVSLEVSPHLAYDTEGTTAAAKRLFAALNRPNAMIKIPGTQEGLPSVEQCLSDGLNINVTLLFGVDNYEQVANAYISALERRAAHGKSLDSVASVASFFVSRVDSLVDKELQERIEAAGSDGESGRLRGLLGKAAVANAKLAYAKYEEMFSGPRWGALAEKGARVQRCLWASTSTKNPSYRDVLYVEPLIGPDTVNTMPDATLEAFRDHGVVARTLDDGVDEARETIRALGEIGIDFSAVTDDLQQQGVKLFEDSFDKVMATLRDKREASVAGA
jgi:transaldolase